jgi:electron transfer flavoprotein alpha subunit
MTNTWIITAGPQIGALVQAGRSLGGTLTIVAVGDRTYPDADSVVSVPVPEGVPVEALAPVVADAVAAQAGDVVLVPNRPAERVLAGAVAARLGAPVLTQPIDFGFGAVAVARYGGIVTETVKASGPVVVVMAGGSAVEDAPASGTQVSGGQLPAKVVAESIAAVADVNLAAAKRIVSVGRGFKSAEDLRLARDLAAALGAEVACSRPLAEGLGWLPKETYVGVSGQTVRPEVYVAVGVSGQLQHMAGAKDAKTIVAVNADENAPIFAHADYGIVGDLYTVLPALTAAVS